MNEAPVGFTAEILEVRVGPTVEIPLETIVRSEGPARPWTLEDLDGFSSHGE